MAAGKPMICRHLILPLVGLVVLTACSTTRAQERQEIRPPFGFSWGESSSRLQKMLEQVKARVVSKEPVDGRMRMHVRGISQRLLTDAYFYFEEDALIEIELHYGDPSWDTAKFMEFFDQTRRHIDTRYGAGRLIARTRNTQGGLTHTLTGHQWSQHGASLQLFFFSAEKGTETVRVLSLHYRGS